MVDTTYQTADTSDSELGNFLSRPVRVKTMLWPVGSQLFDSFDPWTLFCENPRNINRITSFKLLRGKLHLSFKLNGNAFHFGRAIASYIPLAGPAGFDDMTRDRAFFSQDIIAASQRPHVYLDPTTNSGGEMCLPFFWFKNYLEVNQSDWRDMGQVIVHDLGTLKHANDATDTVVVQVYAWMTDVELAIPTSVDPTSLVPQSTVEYNNTRKKKGPTMSRVTKDEYDSAGGIVSGPASTVAKIAGQLSKVPYIAPYAKATQMAAGAVGGIAKLFGYSRPNINTGGSFYRPWVTGNLASGALPDTAIKLSIDPKQETTIDSRVAGLDGTDELDIRSIVTRESYLTSFNWNQTDPVDAKLFSMRVTPALHDVLSVPDGTELHFTPSCLVQNLFGYWHGSMEVRFQFVCSAYHKGRVKIMYDPVDSPNPVEDNVNFTEIVDLAETRDFTIKIGWGRERHWLNTVNDWSVPPVLFDVTGATLEPDGNYFNGTITMSVINELTTPNSVANNNIYVAVSTRMCDDAAFTAPTHAGICNLTYFPVPGATATFTGGELEPQSAIETDVPVAAHDNEAAPETTKVSEVFSAITQDPSFFDIYPGESIDTLRLLLKRYNFHHGVGGGTANNVATIRKVSLHAYPYYRGSPTGAVNIATGGTVAWNYAQNTVMNYLTPAFSGVRGGARWKVFTSPQSDQNHMAHSIAYRLSNRYTGPGGGPYAITSYNRSTSINASNAAHDCLQMWTDPTDMCISANGVVTTQVNMGALEVEIPYYSNVRFYPAKFQNRTTAGNFKLPWGYNFSIYNNSTSNPLRTCALVAAAEDFNLFFFTGAPPMFYVPTPAP